MNAALNLDALYPVALTKCCAKCHRQLPLDSFRVREHQAKPYREGACRQCQAAYKREAYRRRQLGVPPQRAIERSAKRHPDDAACDAAFMGWREAGVAFQGARV